MMEKCREKFFGNHAQGASSENSKRLFCTALMFVYELCQCAALLCASATTFAASGTCFSRTELVCCAFYVSCFATVASNFANATLSHTCKTSSVNVADNSSGD
jgi:uncharacterized membrane protein YkvI